MTDVDGIFDGRASLAAAREELERALEALRHEEGVRVAPVTLPRLESAERAVASYREGSREARSSLAPLEIRLRVRGRCVVAEHVQSASVAAMASGSLVLAITLVVLHTVTAPIAAALVALGLFAIRPFVLARTRWIDVEIVGERVRVRESWLGGWRAATTGLERLRGQLSPSSHFFRPAILNRLLDGAAVYERARAYEEELASV
ncbi:MAG: hypothetical protein U0353_20140 [Sandaracinus sp.]